MKKAGQPCTAQLQGHRAEKAGSVARRKVRSIEPTNALRDRSGESPVQRNPLPAADPSCFPITRQRTPFETIAAHHAPRTPRSQTLSHSVMRETAKLRKTL